MKKLITFLMVTLMMLSFVVYASAAYTMGSSVKQSSDVDIRGDYIPIQIKTRRNSDGVWRETAEASSELRGSQIYYADYAVDGETSTCWQEGKQGHGTGEWIKVPLDEAADIGMIRFRMGNAYSDESFYRNERPAQITVEFSDGSSTTATFPDKNREYCLVLDNPVRADWFKIIIDDVYAGETTKDCCISIIKVYEKDW